MCDNECDFPVRQVFFHPNNVQIIARRIRLATGLNEYQVTGEFLVPYMRPIFEVAPGAGMTDPDAILQHVNDLNSKVVSWASKDAVIGSKFNEHHLKLITGTRPVPDQPVFGTPYGTTRHTSVLLPRYTQFYQPIDPANAATFCRQ